MAIYYKGFNHNMQCRGFQYQEGKTYKEERAEICVSGFHACRYPLDVLNYYPPVDAKGNIQNFHKVSLNEISQEEGWGDSKVCGRQITILDEIPISKLIFCHAEWLKNEIEKQKEEKLFYTSPFDHSHIPVASRKHTSLVRSMGYNCIGTNTGNHSMASCYSPFSAAITTGMCSAANALEYQSIVGVTGIHSVAQVEGEQSIAAATGVASITISDDYASISATTGFSSLAKNSAKQGIAATTGGSSVSVTDGRASVAINTGAQGAAQSNRKGCLAVAWGEEGKAKGSLGSFIVLAEYDKYGEFKGARMGEIDGVVLLPDVYYTLKGGAFIEAENNTETDE